MGKSYRKPYCAITGKYTGSGRDKEFARRCWRRLQEDTLRNFDGDWEDFVNPERYEAKYNDVWSWGRDGVQKYRYLRPEDLNPFHALWRSWESDEKRMSRHEESLAHTIEWLADLKRK